MSGKSCRITRTSATQPHLCPRMDRPAFFIRLFTDERMMWSWIPFIGSGTTAVAAIKRHKGNGSGSRQDPMTIARWLRNASSRNCANLFYCEGGDERMTRPLDPVVTVHQYWFKSVTT